MFMYIYKGGMCCYYSVACLLLDYLTIIIISSLNMDIFNFIEAPFRLLKLGSKCKIGEHDTRTIG